MAGEPLDELLPGGLFGAERAVDEQVLVLEEREVIALSREGSQLSVGARHEA